MILYTILSAYDVLYGSETPSVPAGVLSTCPQDFLSLTALPALSAAKPSVLGTEQIERSLSYDRSRRNNSRTDSGAD